MDIYIICSYAKNAEMYLDQLHFSSSTFTPPSSPGFQTNSVQDLTLSGYVKELGCRF